MTTQEWETKWIEGLAALDQYTVSLERHKHNLDVIEQRLDELDAQAEGKKTWIERIFG